MQKNIDIEVQSQALQYSSIRYRPHFKCEFIVDSGWVNVVLYDSKVITYPFYKNAFHSTPDLKMKGIEQIFILQINLLFSELQYTLTNLHITLIIVI